MLLEGGLDPAIKDNAGWTPLVSFQSLNDYTLCLFVVLCYDFYLSL